MKLSILSTFIMIIMVSLSSCDKEKMNSRMTVRMHDLPADFLEVNIEILEVQTHFESTGWISLKTNAGIYDLLELQNGVSTVIADDETIPSGKMTQMRLILGENNTVVTETDILNLEMSSQDETGLKINVNTVIDPGQDIELMLDFDADQSIVVQGDGSLKLKPVIRLESIEKS